MCPGRVGRHALITLSQKALSMQRIFSASVSGKRKEGTKILPFEKALSVYFSAQGYILCVRFGKEEGVILELFHQHTSLQFISSGSYLCDLCLFDLPYDFSLRSPFSVISGCLCDLSVLFRLCDLSVRDLWFYSPLRSLVLLSAAISGSSLCDLEFFSPRSLVLLSATISGSSLRSNLWKVSNADKSLPTKEEKDEINHSSSSATRTGSNGQRTKRKKSSNIDATEQGLTAAANRLADAFAHIDCARLQKELYNIPELRARGRPTAAVARQLELRRGPLDVVAAPAAAGQRAGLVTSADDGQQTRKRTPAPVDGQRDAKDLTPARRSSESPAAAVSPLLLTQTGLAVRSLPLPRFLFGRQWKTGRDNEEEVAHQLLVRFRRSREEDDQNREFLVD
ncbi:hypothetical protein Syun_012408 [Stephania yunnanensis]|uniref:Uncharacterized protein n=1 Tax=Stephania yunnanensis TaxID=152371 RepID=A0AAP0JZC9_9MAGN